MSCPAFGYLRGLIWACYGLDYIASPLIWWSEVFSPFSQNRFILEGALEIHNGGQNARFGSALAPVPDVNGDGFNDLVVGAPLEDDHKGAIYVFFSQQSRILRKYKQVCQMPWKDRVSICLLRNLMICSYSYILVFLIHSWSLPPLAPQRIAAADLAPGLQYFGRSIHGTMDMNNDGSVDLAVGSLGAVVLLWLVFYPERKKTPKHYNGDKKSHWVTL